MADIVTSQIYDGARHVIGKFTNFSDGTGETGVVKINVSTLVPNPGLHLKLRRVWYSIEGMTVRIQWQASTPIDLVQLSEGESELDFADLYAGGYPNNGGAGVTGNVIFTTVGAVASSNYTISMDFIKGV